MRNLIPVFFGAIAGIALTIALMLAAQLASAPRSADIEDLPCYIAQPIDGTGAIGIFPVACQFEEEDAE